MTTPESVDANDLDARLRARGIGLSLAEQRSRIVMRTFGGNSEKYEEAVKSIHKYIWEVLEATSRPVAERTFVFSHPGTETGAFACWEEDDAAPISCMTTTPTRHLVHTSIAADEITCAQIRLPDLADGPTLMQIGMGIATHPVIQNALVSSLRIAERQLIVPTLREVQGVSGIVVE